MGDFSICFSEHLTGHPSNYINGVAIDDNGTYRFRRATWSVYGVS